VSKKIAIPAAPRSKPTSPEDLDGFVHGNGVAHAAPPVPKARMKRLTLDVEEGLHKRIRRATLEKPGGMAGELRRILEEHFPV
jgi:hypothetical protein